MAQSITVPAGFKADFALVCDRSGMTEREENQLRNVVRSDFAAHGPWVQQTARVYRFADETWGGLPRPDLCQGFLAHHGQFYDDDLFKRLGILEQVRMCMEAAEATQSASADAPADTASS
jgi:hypothetical protein